jgi:hypothetical protein
MHKPHFRRLKGYWTCSADGRTGYGVTPRSAWEQWKAIDPSARPEARRQAAMNSQAVALMRALEQWKPGAVH